MKRHAMIGAALALAACGAPGNGESGAMGSMDAGQESGAIRVSGRQAALAGVTYVIAREAELERTVRAVAMAVTDERTLAIVNARVGGWVEKLYANETGRHVLAGEPLLELYAPDLVSAQAELLLAKRLPATAAGDLLVAASRRRLELWDISADQISELEQAGVVRRTLTIRSAYPGHILEKHVIEGQAVRPGDPLFRIADLSTVWIEPAIFERDIPLVRTGQVARVRFNALSGREFEGRVTFLYPTLDEATRTLQIRLEVPNPALSIRPGMYGVVRISAIGPPGVVIPLTALLPTGERDLVFVVRGDGVLPTAVTVGERGDATVLVTDGVAAGDTVVASATFLFDSESSLAAAMQGIMLNMGMGLDMGGMEMDMDMEEEMQGDGEPEGEEGGGR